MSQQGIKPEPTLWDKHSSKELFERHIYSYYEHLNISLQQHKQ
jgi:hypothetical protein